MPPPPSIGVTQAVFVDWLAPQPGDLTRFSDALGSGLVVPYEESGHAHGQEQGEQNGRAEDHEHAAGGGHDHEHGHAQEGGTQGALLLGATCHQLAPHFPGTTCSTSGPFKLSTATEQKLAQTLAAVHEPGTEVNLVPINDIDAGGSAVVFGDARLQNLDDRVRIAAMQTLLVPSVYTSLSLSATTLQFSPAWVTGGWSVALVALSIGGVVLFIDRFMRTREHRLSRLATGSNPPPKPVALEAWYFAASYGTVVVTGSSVGITACAMTVAGASSVSMPWPRLGIVLGVAVVIGIIGGFGILFLNRVVERNR